MVSTRLVFFQILRNWKYLFLLFPEVVIHICLENACLPGGINEKFNVFSQITYDDGLVGRQCRPCWKNDAGLVGRRRRPCWKTMPALFVFNFPHFYSGFLVLFFGINVSRALVYFYFRHSELESLNLREEHHRPAKNIRQRLNCYARRSWVWLWGWDIIYVGYTWTAEARLLLASKPLYSESTPY